MLVVYGVKLVDADNPNTFTVSYDTIFATSELAQQFIDFTADCLCNRCRPYKNTQAVIVIIPVPTEIVIRQDNDDEPEDAVLPPEPKSIEEWITLIDNINPSALKGLN